MCRQTAGSAINGILSHLRFIPTVVVDDIEIVGIVIALITCNQIGIKDHIVQKPKVNHTQSTLGRCCCIEHQPIAVNLPIPIIVHTQTRHKIARFVGIQHIVLYPIPIVSRIATIREVHQSTAAAIRTKLAATQYVSGHFQIRNRLQIQSIRTTRLVRQQSIQFIFLQQEILSFRDFHPHHIVQCSDPPKRVPRHHNGIG